MTRQCKREDPRHPRRPHRRARLVVRVCVLAALAAALLLVDWPQVTAWLLGGSPISISAESLVVRTRELGRLVTFEKQEEGEVSQSYVLYYHAVLPYTYTLSAGIDFERTEIDAGDPERLILYLPDAEIISESMTWGTKQISGLGASLFDGAREQKLKTDKEQELRARFLSENADEDGRSLLQRAWDKAAQTVVDFARQFTVDESVEIIALPLSAADGA